MFAVAAAFALLGLRSIVAASGVFEDLDFMTAVQVRELFDDEDFVFDYNPLINVDVIEELGG